MRTTPRIIRDGDIATRYFRAYLPMAELLGPVEPVAFADDNLQAASRDTRLEIPLQNGTTVNPPIVTEWGEG